MRERAYPLSKAKVRQSWNKFNLYNLARVVQPSYKNATFFQQKWKAKSLLRAYHAEHVREGQWTRMFIRRPRSVIPMDPKKMAQNDGSNESAGRGSGLQKPERSKKELPIPYMQMTFAPLERRLDIAIYRAMFASSARQARQFVVHGAVKVNGKKMIYPGYLLNPGDLFQVEPDRVLYATGQPKGYAGDTSSTVDEDAAIAEGAEEKAEQDPEIDREQEPEVEEKDPRAIMKSLITQSRSILSGSDTLSAKRKQDLRFFKKSVQTALSRSRSASGTSGTILTDSLEAQFLELKALIDRPSDLPQSPAEQKPRISDPDYVPPTQRPADQKTDSEPEETTETDLENVRQALSIAYDDNPRDPSKAYATPWAPRDYMSAFAFIPRYLEVNHNICAAVYLRHPVARPGLAEVPTPFSETLGTAAFAWYLRRR